ncbi:helix-turn-helix transcriptional regulator [Bdellovibrionota bacterium FG-2]
MTSKKHISPNASKIKISRSNDRRRSVVDVWNHLYHVRMEIRTNLPAKQRRAIAVYFFKHLRPCLKHDFSISLQHDTFRGDFEDIKRRGLPTFQSSKNEKLRKNGFNIRMRRLDLGWTLNELAQASGIDASHLSELERGLYAPRALTLKKLEKALFGFPSIPEFG